MDDNLLRYAIIGSGATGIAVARQFAREGTTVAIASSLGFAALRPIIEELGPKVVACSIPAALDADVIIFAEPISAKTLRFAKGQDWISLDAPGDELSGVGTAMCG